MLADQRIDHHVAGTGIERDHLVRGRAGWNRGDVGDAADVQRHAMAPRMAEQQIIDERHERRALASGRNVGRTEIRDHRDAGALGDHAGFADLQRGDAAFVIDGLAVAADQFHAVEPGAE